MYSMGFLRKTWNQVFLAQLAGAAEYTDCIYVER